ncbi:MAG: SIMPL domain-containing protein [Rhodoferax sp.]|uniref:SIMPL domain-containing protein n=1 Tax=Rhodoferax sp. TaxID=50421 RepID=UPI0013FE9F0A|nr:SIMPL domain-containing protein [Rhodoferax sp.]NDP40129.1 SIMPL domain-containing protein [Rhodoferax sp.]
MKYTIKLIAACALLTGAGGLFAQQYVQPAVQNVVQLSATGSIEVPQDLLSIAMSTTRDGSDASAVQGQLKSALDAALAEAKKTAQLGQLDVRTGNFSLYPRYGRDGKPIGWQGTAELILEGRDVARISSAAGKIQTLTVSNVSFSLSREQRTRVESEAQGIAIERFKARAGDISRAFGFTGYTLREVNVSANDQGYSPRPRMMAMEAKTVADASVPVEAGKTAVLVTVSGSVQLK